MSGGASVLRETPLVESRSLGALLGFEALAFKLETCQPTGSWLDREAAVLVERAMEEGVTGLCIVDAHVLALPLAVQCARAGSRLVVLRSGTDSQDDASRAVGLMTPSAAEGWLAALGARQLTVQATPEELAAAAEQIAAGAGLLLVTDGPVNHPPLKRELPHGGIGLEAVAAEIEASGRNGAVLAVPGLTGHEPTILTSLAERRSASVPLPLDELAGSGIGRPTCPFAVVGELGSGSEAATTAAGSALAVAVSAREADAARVLLAREEGLIVSPAGAAALAALIRAVRADRVRRPRERRFPRTPAAVVVLSGDPLGVDGSQPRAADAIPGRAVTLAEIVADPLRLLVEPPGTG